MITIKSPLFYFLIIPQQIFHFEPIRHIFNFFNNSINKLHLKVVGVGMMQLRQDILTCNRLKSYLILIF